MFEAIVEKATLESFLEVQTALVDEARWHLDDDALRMAAVEPGNVGMVEAEIDRTSFESYRVDGGIIGVNLGRVADYIDDADSGDLVHLDLDAETRKLRVDNGLTEYDLALIDQQSIREEPSDIDLELPAHVGMDGWAFERAINAAEKVSDHVAIIVDPDEPAITFDAEGDTDTATTTLGKDELLKVNDGYDEVRSLFSLDYLEDIAGPIDGDGPVRLQVGEEKPLKIEYALADDGVSVTNSLAPRIESS